MKRCPTCNRTFDDDDVIVCSDDGSALLGARETATPQAYGGLGGKATWNPSENQIAEIKQYVATQARPQRKIWPWLVIAAIILVALIIVGVIVVARL